MITCTRRTAIAIECAEAQTAASQHEHAEPAVVSQLGLGSSRFGNTTLILTRKSENLYFNRAIAVGMSSASSERQLDRILEVARNQRNDRLAFDLSPLARPSGIESWLSRRGFTKGSPSAKLWRGNQPLARATQQNQQFRVRLVRSADASAWVDVVSTTWQSFGFRRAWYEGRMQSPGWRHYLAWDGEYPVGTGALYVSDVGGRRVGHLLDGTTQRSYRRRGVQGQIIRRRIADGLKLGCDLFTSETAPPLPRMPLVSYRNLGRQGFALAYLRDSWVGSPPR